MSEKPLDLDALRHAIAAAPAQGAVAGVSRAWLEQAEREIRQGRAAQALVNAHENIALACAEIHAGCPA